MALVYPNEKSPSLRTWATLALSTAADGLTSADVVDMGGLSLSAISLSTLCGTSNTYSFRGGFSAGTTAGSSDGLSDLQQLLNSTGSLIVFGTTTVNSQNSKFIFDPSIFAGIRFLQIVSNTTSAPNANSPGATAKVILTSLGGWK